jgi:hypothetical protein
MPGEAKLMASTSKPSSALSPTVIATAAIWIRLIGLEDRVSRGSGIVNIATPKDLPAMIWHESRAVARDAPRSLNPARRSRLLERRRAG